MTEADAEDFTDAIEEASKVFDNLCQLRHDKVAEAEGPFTFLTIDVLTQMLESLADCAIMCRKQFIKLLMYQHLMEEELAPATMGVKSFKRVGEDGLGRD